MGKIIEKLKEIGKNWIKQFGEIAIIAITVILSAFTLGKIKDIIEIRDYKKKEEIKDSIDETKQTVEEINFYTKHKRNPDVPFHLEAEESAGTIQIF